MSLLKKISVVSLNVTDWDKAKAFYGETLDLPISLDLGPEIGWCEFGETDKAALAINLWRDSQPPRGGGATPIFDVDDCHKTVAELRRRGAKCDDAETIPGRVIFANIFDPEGNRIQIAQLLTAG